MTPIRTMTIAIEWRNTSRSLHRVVRGFEYFHEAMTNVDLLRRLGFKESFAIVVGSIIGTGVFLKTAVMAQEAGSPLYVLLALLTAGTCRS